MGKPLQVAANSQFIEFPSLHLSPVAINLGLKPYQKERITAFINPDIDPQGSAWAINQSLIAIGSGGSYALAAARHFPQVPASMLGLAGRLCQERSPGERR